MVDGNVIEYATITIAPMPHNSVKHSSSVPDTLFSMPSSHNGGCLCGDVSLSIASEPVVVLSCYCKHCQKNAGGPSQVIAKFNAEDVVIKTSTPDAISKVTLHDTASGSPKEKAFCRNCGCTLWTVPASAAGKFYIVRTSLLDNGFELKPNNELFVKNRPAWMSAVEGVPQWKEMRT